MFSLSPAYRDERRLHAPHWAVHLFHSVCQTASVFKYMHIQSQASFFSFFSSFSINTLFN